MRRLSAVNRWLPVGYMAAALALAILILPSSLRPPPQAPPTSAELSPDAPPEDSEVLLTELSRGQSTTAGAGLEVPGDTEGGDVPVPGPGEAKPRKGRCFGNPPRQTESLYSAPCAPAFVGSNGGATSKGVTGNEINIGIRWDADYTGPVREDGTSAEERETRTWQAYFNDRYELYGRRIRIIGIATGMLGETDPAQSKAEMAEADQKWPLFGFLGQSADYVLYEEAMRRKVVIFDTDATNPISFYRQHHPFAYSWIMDANKNIAINTELICKQLSGKPPDLNGRRDPTFDYTKPRVFGMLAYEESQGFRRGAPDLVRQGLAKCDDRLEEVIEYNLYAGSGEQSEVATAVTRMRAAGVTTLLVWTEGLTQVSWTNEAFSSGYFPEWLVLSANHSSNGLAQLYHQESWRNAIFPSGLEIPRPPGHTDCAVAYKSQDPDNNPSNCLEHYYALLQFANGIQGAGPVLDPQTFFEGLKRMPCRAPVPEWSIGGCYGDDDFTFMDYVALAWWDPEADPPENGNSGAYRYMYDGKRFKLGEIPAESPWGREGITTPPDPVQYE